MKAEEPVDLSESEMDSSAGAHSARLRWRRPTDKRRSIARHGRDEERRNLGQPNLSLLEEIQDRGAGYIDRCV